MPLPISNDFRRVMREVVGSRPQREVAELAGISLPYVNQMLNGKVPSLPMLTKLADGLALDARVRGRLFAAAGYQPSLQGDLPADLAYVVDEMKSLSPQQLETVRRLVEHPERIDALAALIGDRRVMHALASGYAA